MRLAKNSGASAANLGGAFAGVQTVMVILASVLVILTIVLLALWLRRVNRESTAAVRLHPDTVTAPLAEATALARSLARLDALHTDGHISDVEYSVTREVILTEPLIDRAMREASAVPGRSRHRRPGTPRTAGRPPGR